METRSVRPYGGVWQVVRRHAGDDPFAQFRREIDRLFEDMFGGFGMPAPWSGVRGGQGGMTAPSLEMGETDREIKVCAELPGIDEKDIEVTLDDDLLTIRGEKRLKREVGEAGRNYHLSERSYGSFARSLRLPAAPDPDAVQASFRDGVLTITMPKPQEAAQRSWRIEVRAEGGGGAAPAGVGGTSGAGQGAPVGQGQRTEAQTGS